MELHFLLFSWTHQYYSMKVIIRRHFFVKNGRYDTNTFISRDYNYSIKYFI